MKPSEIGYKLIAEGFAADKVREFLTVYTQQPGMFQAFAARVMRLDSIGERRSSTWIFDDLRRNPSIDCQCGKFHVDNTLSPMFARAFAWTNPMYAKFFKFKGDSRRKAA